MCTEGETPVCLSKAVSQSHSSKTTQCRNMQVQWGSTMQIAQFSLVLLEFRRTKEIWPVTPLRGDKTHPFSQASSARGKNLAESDHLIQHLVPMMVSLEAHLESPQTAAHPLRFAPVPEAFVLWLPLLLLLYYYYTTTTTNYYYRTWGGLQQIWRHWLKCNTVRQKKRPRQPWTLYKRCPLI